MLHRIAASLLLLALSAGAHAVVVIDLTGSGGNLGPTTTFSGDNGVELTVPATRNPTNIADPFVTDNIRQNGRGIGTQIGNNGLGNDNNNFFAQLLSFGVNKGRIVGIEITGFRHGNRNRVGEELNLLGSPTAEPVPPPGDGIEFVAFLEAIPGNPDFFEVPKFRGPWLQVVSALIDFPTNARISAIHVAEPGALGLVGLGALTLLIRARARRRRV